MIKVVFKYLIYLAFFIVCFMVFLPKENLYFLLEKRLVAKKVIVSDEKFKEELFSLQVNDSQIYYDDIKFAKIGGIEVRPYLFLNTVHIKKVDVLDEFKNFIPQRIDYVKVKHSVLNPLFIDIVSKGEFGDLRGRANLLDRKMVFYLKASKRMKSKYRNILRKMKLKEGEYTYEYKF